MPREIKELLQGAPESLDELFGQSVDCGVLEPNWQIRGYQSAMMRVLNGSVFPEGEDGWRKVLVLAACNQDQVARRGGRRETPLPEGHTPEGWPLSAGKFLRYAMLQVVRCLPSSQVEEPVKNVDEEAASPGSLKGLLRYARRRHLLACKGKEGWLDLATKILCHIERHPLVESIKESLRAIHEVAEATAKGRRIPIREDILRDSLRCIWELLEEWPEWPPEDEGEIPFNIVAPAASSNTVLSAVDPSSQQMHNNLHENFENPLESFLEAEEARMEALLRELKPA